MGGRVKEGETRRLCARSILNQMSSIEEADQVLRRIRGELQGSPFRVMERWMEMQGRLAFPVWVTMRRVSVHAWNKEVFRLLGNCVGRTLVVDGKTTLKEDLEVGRVKLFLDRAGSLPSVVSLWVQDICFLVEIAEDVAAAWDLEDFSGACSSGIPLSAERGVKTMENLRHPR